MRYTVTGRVHPERADIHFSRIEWQLQGDGRAVAQCHSSQLTVVLENPSVDGWISGFIMAEQLAHIVIGALGFSLGSGYSVELIQITEEDGTPHVFGVAQQTPLVKAWASIRMPSLESCIPTSAVYH